MENVTLEKLTKGYSAQYHLFSTKKENVREQM